MLKSVFQPLAAWYLGALKTGGYPLIVLLMTLESSFLPIPAEVIIPPAAHLAWAGDGLRLFAFHLSGWPAQIAIVAAGVLGSWLGTTLMYGLARMAGRPLVLRYGKLVLFPPEKLEKAERWMSHYGPMGVLIARLLPGARQLVGIPTGIARMDYKLFSIFTLLGAAIWCSVLCWLGVRIGADVSKGEMHRVMFWVGGVALALGALYYFFVHRHLTGKTGGRMPRAE
ncbi:MAG: DedA family protein [Verrucomicrobiota bacterium]|nr:DedA family protein [Verrucomicrobiota bacterium]